MLGSISLGWGLAFSHPTTHCLGPEGALRILSLSQAVSCQPRATITTASLGTPQPTPPWQHHEPLEGAS